MADGNIELIGQEWTVSVTEKRSLGDYENVEPFVSVSGEIPADVGVLGDEARTELKARLLELQKELQEVVERTADNRVALEDAEDWSVSDDDAGTGE